MADPFTLQTPPAASLATRRKPRFPSESAAYARAREALLAEKSAFSGRSTRWQRSGARFPKGR